MHSRKIIIKRLKAEEIWVSLNFLQLSKYEISNRGRLRNVKSGKYLKGSVRNGYIRADGLSADDGKIISKAFHTLVALAFLGSPKEGETVDHIDRNKSNNHINNLRWACIDTQNSNRCKPKIIKGRSIYQYELNGDFIRKWDKISDAAKALSLEIRYITDVCRGRKKTCGGFIWKYADDIEINEEEIWKQVTYVNVDNVLVSNMGRVKSISGVMKGSISNGYRLVALKNLSTGKLSTFSVHRLIANTFLGKSHLVVNHKDCNKLNNHIDNLEFVTREKNIKHSLENKKRIYRAKQVKQFSLRREFIEEFQSAKIAGEIIGVSHSSIRKCCAGIYATSGGFLWEYVN